MSIQVDNIHTISLHVANKPGVLLRITLMFARRGYNIESLVVSSALDGKFSRMTITAQGAPETLDQIIRQANNLIDVVHASEHNDEEAIAKEMVLIKVKLSKTNKNEILQVIDHFKAQSVDLTQKSAIIQAVGDSDRIDALIDMLKDYGIIETVRSGKLVMARGDQST